MNNRCNSYTRTISSQMQLYRWIARIRLIATSIISLYGNSFLFYAFWSDNISNGRNHLRRFFACVYAWCICYTLFIQTHDDNYTLNGHSCLRMHNKISIQITIPWRLVYLLGAHCIECCIQLAERRENNDLFSWDFIIVDDIKLIEIQI